MKTVFVIAFLFLSFSSFCQKPIIDAKALQNWPHLKDDANITNDGKYCFYRVETKQQGSTLFIWSKQNAEIRKRLRVTGADFTHDSRFIVYLNSNDSLGILSLEDGRELSFVGVRSYKLLGSGDSTFIAYLKSDGELVLLNLLSGYQQVFQNIYDYSFCAGGTALLIQANGANELKGMQCISLVDLNTFKTTKVLNVGKILKIAFGEHDLRLAIMARSGDNELDNVIWYYKQGVDNASVLVDTSQPKMKGLYLAQDFLHLSKSGDKVFFKLKSRPVKSANELEHAKVAIWDYRSKDEPGWDEAMKSFRSGQNTDMSCLSVVNAINRNIIFLQNQTDDSWFEISGNGDFILTKTSVNTVESALSRKLCPNIYLVRISDGTRIVLINNLCHTQPHFSPHGQYVYWYDRNLRAYYTYNLSKGVVRNISKKVSTPLYDEVDDHAMPPINYGVAAWVENDTSFIIYDRYDLWLLDADGVKLPINITNGYGRRNKVVLRNVYVNGDIRYWEVDPLNLGEQLLLCGFNERNKKNSFFEKRLGVSGNPMQLSESSKSIYFSSNISFVGFPSFIKKAKTADLYLLQQMSATEHPNYVITKDFKSFERISNLQPQLLYNWHTTELYTWKTLRGNKAEGILYKPDNFDSSKKYPIIFYFYEQLSAGLNQFTQPGWSPGQINIPWFVSRGYLVFCPDIQYTVGKPGESVFEYVVSAAKMMSEKMWVDPERMGIQGHSWGGYEVNYLVTRTKLFSAAASAAGPTDFVSIAGLGAFAMCAGPAFTEKANYRMGVSMWDNNSVYINNSPLFTADKVTTPLLIMHNKKDILVPWSQAIEFYTALRRLGKTCWMLEYEKGGHTVYNQEAEDYTEKLEDFFNHYLKRAPAPNWMTQGTNTRLKEFKGENGCSKACVICKSLLAKTPKEINRIKE